MNHKKFLLNVILGTTMVCLTGCKSPQERGHKNESYKPRPKQAIKINIVSEPYSLDPRKARSLNDINLSKMFMEGLTRIKNNSDPVLAAAKDVSVSEDGLTYTFTLRDSCWSNGDKVTSYDFAYSWKKVLSPDFLAPQAHQLYVIKNAKEINQGNLPISLLGVNCPDDKTLIIHLEHPVPYFLKLTALPVFYPVNQGVDKRNSNWAFSVETYVGNGPFKMKSWTHRDKIIAIKNDGYWDATNVKLEEIEMLMVSEDTGLKMFENNELQWEGSPWSVIPNEAIETLKKENLLNTAPGLETFLVHTNTTKGPLVSSHIRKALALSINRQDIVDFVTLGNAPSTGIVPNSIGLQKVPYFKDADYQGAVTAFEDGLKELNLSKEDLNDLKLTYPDQEMFHKLAQTLQQQWFETLGILVKLDPVELTSYEKKSEQRDFDLLCGQWKGELSDPIAFLNAFISKTNDINSTNWEDPEFTKSIQTSFICKDTKQREEILRSAEKMIMDAMPAIPVFNTSMHYVKDNKVKHVELTDSGQIDYRWAYVDHS